ncbi:plant cysteine oxidase 2-like [Typha angustifolia]|uniref:plant cysteine oxidase 2-like n=1 Tax=Typha angustifolia TaxID=59011 RepID=UPI003C2D5B27
MRLDGKLADRRGGIESATEKGKSSSKKSKRRQKKPLKAVQTLFNTCKEVFADGGAGTIPSQEDVRRLSSILDTLGPENVGLNPNLPFFRCIESERPPSITYLHLYEDSKFSIGIFCLPKSAVIPLHNHPGMTVFGKLLFGSMHIKSYDWVDSESSEIVPPTEGLCLAKVKMDAVLKAPCQTSILYPASGGNMHRFTAVTPCAVLDVLGPPYSTPEGRVCTYYDDFPYTNSPGDTVLHGEVDGYAWLKARAEKPEDFTVGSAEYRGPKIVNK